MPIEIMTGTSLVGSRSSGIFNFPMMIMVDGSPYHSRGSFTMPLLIMEGTSRSIPITVIYRGVVMNLFNQAISTYSNYPFNSLAYFNGRYLGATDSGIYILQGNHDNDRNILSKIKTGPMDFGKKFLKYIRDVWLTYRTDGHLGLVLSVDEDNSTEVERITILVNPTELQEEKIKVPRGLKGRYYTIELKNKSGADFNIDNLEIMVDVITGKKR